jgi:hypothetical protein
MVVAAEYPLQNTRHHRLLQFPMDKCTLFQQLSMYPPRRRTVSRVSFTMYLSVNWSIVQNPPTGDAKHHQAHVQKVVQKQ